MRRAAKLEEADIIVVLLACLLLKDINKVFASLGIAVNVTEEDILPDYSKPVGAFYISVARFLLSSSSGHELDFLGHVERPAEDSESSYFMDKAVPSWVPDWRANYYPFTFQKFIKANEPLATNLYWEFSYRCESRPSLSSRLRSYSRHDYQSVTGLRRNLSSLRTVD